MTCSRSRSVRPSSSVRVCMRTPVVGERDLGGPAVGEREPRDEPQRVHHEQDPGEREDGRDDRAARRGDGLTLETDLAQRRLARRRRADASSIGSCRRGARSAATLRATADSDAESAAHPTMASPRPSAVPLPSSMRRTRSPMAVHRSSASSPSARSRRGVASNAVCVASQRMSPASRSSSSRRASAMAWAQSAAASARCGFAVGARAEHVERVAERACPRRRARASPRRQRPRPSR